MSTNIAVLGAQVGATKAKARSVEPAHAHFSDGCPLPGGKQRWPHRVRGWPEVSCCISFPPASCIPVHLLIGNVWCSIRRRLQGNRRVARMGVAVDGRLLISEKAHLSACTHRELDVLSEARARRQRRSGTPSRGIGTGVRGPRFGRRGIRVCDLLGRSGRAGLRLREKRQRRNRIIRDDARLEAGVRAVLAFGLDAAGRDRFALPVADLPRQSPRDVRRSAGDAPIRSRTYPFVTPRTHLGRRLHRLGLPPERFTACLAWQAYTTGRLRVRCRRNCSAELAERSARADRSMGLYREAAPLRLV